MKVLVTGANGFIGKNLVVHLNQMPGLEVSTFLRHDSVDSLATKVKSTDFIYHLAGVNRPVNDEEFIEDNVELTRKLCESISQSERNIPVVFSSSIQAGNDNIYGESKRFAEKLFCTLNKETGNPVYIYRLPNVFGKWCRPNYNSVVATFCYNLVHDLPLIISDPASKLQLVYIDDVVSEFINLMDIRSTEVSSRTISSVYNITVGQLEKQLRLFQESRKTLLSEAVGTGLLRALYSTYISYLEPAQFSYPLIKNEDSRGVFVELLKTRDSGQFSFFTAHPGITRGGHYHHSKTEKFIVVKGKASFRFRHIETKETHTIITVAEEPQVVETIPGWAHDITNVGDDEMIVFLWANENYDPEYPDTVSDIF